MLGRSPREALQRLSPTTDIEDLTSRVQERLNAREEARLYEVVLVMSKNMELMTDHIFDLRTTIKTLENKLKLIIEA